MGMASECSARLMDCVMSVLFMSKWFVVAKFLLRQAAVPSDDFIPRILHSSQKNVVCWLSFDLFLLTASGLLPLQVLCHPQHPLIDVVGELSGHWQWDDNVGDNANTFREVFLVKTGIYGCGITYLHLAVG
jgi:hypothetical protein